MRFLISRMVLARHHRLLVNTEHPKSKSCKISQNQGSDRAQKLKTNLRQRDLQGHHSVMNSEAHRQATGNSILRIGSCD